MDNQDQSLQAGGEAINPVRSTECLRCGRPLKSAKSRAIGMGPVCAAKGDVLDPFALNEADVAAVVNDVRYRVASTFLGDPDSNFNEAGLVCERGPSDEPRTNIPHTWKLHSPTGFEWGYAGSGPADLALNTLLRLGLAREDAERLHHPFKNAYLVSMPHAGGRIGLGELRQWITQQGGA